MIQKWSKQKEIQLDGYSSTSFDEMTARRFAAENETDHLDQVIMKITIENQSNKHYLCLNRSDYTCYPDEREILL